MVLNFEDKGEFESSLFDYGFFRTGVFKDILSPWESLFQGIDEVQVIPEIKPQSPGYSALLDIHSIHGLHDACVRVAKVVIESLPVNYIFRPRVLGVHLLKSMYCPETANAGPTRAFLWHRDLDDYFSPQIKVMIPMVNVSADNGMFSALEKRVCPLSHSLLDCSVSSKFSFLDESDSKCRIRDDVLRRHYNSSVVDFDASPSEAFIVDTNSVYHKGGMVLVEGLFRISIQITIGSALHSWNNSKLLQRNLLRRFCGAFPAGFGFYSYFNQVRSRPRNMIILD